jgi:hypothetical protein
VLAEVVVRKLPSRPRMAKSKFHRGPESKADLVLINSRQWTIAQNLRLTPGACNWLQARFCGCQEAQKPGMIRLKSHWACCQTVQTEQKVVKYSARLQITQYRSEPLFPPSPFLSAPSKETVGIMYAETVLQSPKRSRRAWARKSASETGMIGSNSTVVLG